MSDDALTPAQRSAAKQSSRVGACAALACSRACEAYVFDRHEDGFDMCQCGHTQWSHGKVDA